MEFTEKQKRIIVAGLQQLLADLKDFPEDMPDVSMDEVEQLIEQMEA